MKNIFTINPDAPFLDTLAAELWGRTKGDGFLLSRHLVLLPTRRACRNLAEAFSRIAGGKPVLLPRMRPLGDTDEEEMAFAGSDAPDIPPAVLPLKRLMLLARQVRARDASMSWDQAAMAAEALAKFLDQIQIENCGIGRLPSLVEEQELAEHWQQTLAFLEIVTRNWPLILEAQGCIDPAQRRNMVMAAQTELWRKNPPDFPVIAAGSTGSVPSTAELLDTIASMPLGAVVLPGLDRYMDNEAWDEVDDPHPQHSMKKLLEKMGVDRNDVSLFGEDRQSLRVRLISEAMRPAAVTEEWRKLRGNLGADAVSGLTRMTLDHPQEEAQVIALCLRETLETPDKTATLVTADRGLARRVAALMHRWGIEIDDSGGSPLASSPPGAFLNLVLSAADPCSDANDLLALLKHPYAACGVVPAVCRAQAREAEIRARKGEEEDFSTIKSLLLSLTENWDEPLPLSERIEQHIRISEAVAEAESESGADRLWKFDVGEDAAAWLDEWREAAGDFPAVSGEDYMALFATLSRAKTVRPRRTSHPRIGILGPLEARMCASDLIIMGGLNEGSWPQDVGFDPWMSRPMRKKFGLPSPEFRIGQAAHDFAQLACAKEVVLTRSLRSGGNPSVPSRFILQLEAVLRAAGLSDDTTDALACAKPWREWARALDMPQPLEMKPCERPQPCPPTKDRPNALSVTEISTWLRNPYAIYAKHVLKLRKLDELDAEPDASDRGTLVHATLERFVREFPRELPQDAKMCLMEIWRDELAKDKSNPRVRAFWSARFADIAEWFIEHERERREVKGVRPLALEIKGTTNIGSFILTGQADRIDGGQDGSISIVDYKTGAAPKKEEVLSGIEPQLQLLALIAARGGFNAIEASTPSSCEYWAMKKESKPTSFAKELPELMEHAEIGLENLIATFANPETPYEATPRARLQPRHNDYAHLSRLAEWGRTSS